MENHIVEVVWSLLGITGTGIVAYVARGIVKYIISHHLEFLSKQAVLYAEDAFEKYRGETKLKHACEWVSQQLAHYHIKVSESQIEGAVRAAYTEFKNDITKDLQVAK